MKAPRFAVDLVVAFQFLTRLPVPQVEFAPDGLARSVKFFPVVGLAIGAGAAGLEKVLSPHLGKPVTAVVVLVFLVLITGGLHEDGFADVADSLGGWNREQRLNILRDSRIGSFGATALAITLLSRGVLLAEVPLGYLVCAHVLCRWSMLPMSYFLPPAREGEGQGARIARVTSLGSLLFGSVFTVATVGAILRWQSIAPLLAAVVVSLLSSWFYLRKLGGVTGDCFGATNQLTEIAVYLCGVWKP
jgi:adenosylcobinamide-GDP ribazoletransferase